MGNWNKPSVVPAISLSKRSVRDIRKGNSIILISYTNTNDGSS